ncbi:hypothetical protein G3O06_07770 [Burkholderia sp. Ac-20345]|uniref:hypothetical protein n=1 Tax=Burkholderia sp. Ac-20345 TaxID=2703891 RepID=UPI00197B0F5B|nr:hypothetical protein [Burkholderia sp. Ac-20345]MBN3777448.1 hypothetical protein [Burkholderia sp. Ac-20345]
MADAVEITNWGGMADPLQSGYYGALNQVWLNQQANADTWAAKALANDDANRAQHQKDVDAWTKWQNEWLTAWAVAQAAYAAAQVLLANNALEAAKDAANKQYDLANRQLTIAEEEYARFKAHFAPCEDATIDAECARPEYTEPIEDEANRAVVEIRAQFSNAQQQAQRRRNRYCIGATIATDRQLVIDQARASGEAKERVRRYLENRQFDRQQIYFNRKLQLFNIGRGMPAEAIQGIGTAASLLQRGSDLELAARNQFYGAILSGLGGVMGAGLSAYMGPSPVSSTQGARSGSSIGGFGGFSSVTSFGAGFGGAGMMGSGGLGYGFGSGTGSASSMWDANSLGPTATYA